MKYTTLEQMIIDANEAYRSGNPIYSDNEYDELVDQLKRDYPESSLLQKGVIEKPSSRKEKLPIPMFSLNKVKSLEEFKKWYQSKGLNPEDSIIITPKLDGISLVVDENNDSCWTRGDGEYGQKSNDHFLIIDRRPKIGVHHYSWGEAIMSRENFVKFKDQFANARNLVAGLFNQKEPSNDLQYVDYIRYGSNLQLDKSDQLLKLNKVNKVAIPFEVCQYTKLTKYYLDQLFTLWSENYQIDGLVIEVNDFNLREKLGREENMNPAYAVAYKNPSWSSTQETKVLDITWGVSKQGKLKPVIQIEPVELSGAMISNVTGYNAAYVIDNNIAKVSIIKVTRSGDVIPKHLETISYDQDSVEDMIDELMFCPSCEEVVKWDNTMTELICSNPKCKEKEVSKLIHFFSTLEVENFGEPSIRQLYNEGYNTINKILNIKIEELVELDGWGYVSASTLLNQFQYLSKHGIPVARLWHALDIFEGKIGEKTCQMILDNLTEMDLVDFRMVSFEKLTSIHGVSNITAAIFKDGIMLLIDNKEYLNCPVEISYVQTPKVKSKSDKLFGYKICFTGFRDKSLEEIIKSEGGEVVSGVSKNTTILIAKDLGERSSKIQKAKELNIPIHSHQDFLIEFILN